jgi:hypothetical protein
MSTKCEKATKKITFPLNAWTNRSPCPQIQRAVTSLIDLILKEKEKKVRDLEIEIIQKQETAIEPLKLQFENLPTKVQVVEMQLSTVSEERNEESITAVEQLTDVSCVRF